MKWPTEVADGSLIPVGGVGNSTHQAAGNDGSDGDGDDPTGVDPSNHAPVDSTPVTVAKTDTDDGTGDALSGRDGKSCDVELAQVPIEEYYVTYRAGWRQQQRRRRQAPWRNHARAT